MIRLWMLSGLFILLLSGCGETTINADIDSDTTLESGTTTDSESSTTTESDTSTTEDDESSSTTEGDTDSSTEGESSTDGESNSSTETDSSTESEPEADTEVPVITLSSHNDVDSFTATYTVAIEGTVTDNDAVASLTLSINGGETSELSYDDSGAFSSDITFDKADNEIVLTATDISGNSSSNTVILNYVATGLLDEMDFNSVGYNSSDVAGSHDSGNAVAIADDGSLYIAGYAREATSTGYDMALWHVNSDGTLDSGFNSSGYVTLAGAAGGTSHDFANDLVIDSNGKIVMVGHSRTTSGDYDLVLARFNSDGTLDTTFGGDVNPADSTPDGFVVVDVSGSGSAEEGTGLVIDDSGNIYVAGNSNADGNNDLVVWKFDSNGALDTAFAGGAGYLSYDSGGDDKAKALIMDDNGNLLIAGAASGNMVVWRVLATGVSDTGFNGNGIVTATGGGGSTSGNGITIDTDGNILVAGTTVITGNLNDMVLWRVTSSGVLDSSFGGDYDLDGSPDGYVTHDGAGGAYNDFDYGYAVAVDAAGNILVAGSAMADNSGSIRADMAVWRYTAAGVLDISFGDDVNPADSTPDGFFAHNGASGGNNADQGKAIIIDDLGRVIVAGESVSTNGSDMAIWRLY